MIDVAQPKAAGPIIYYSDPNGQPFYSLTPRRTDDGQPYVAVHASEDVSVDWPRPKPIGRQADRKDHLLPQSDGLPDTSPVPKKDSMGMDYIPVYEGEDSDDNTVKVSPGKIQRTGVKTELVGKRAITRTIKAPGVIAARRATLSVVAMRFDGFINKVGAGHQRHARQARATR